MIDPIRVLPSSLQGKVKAPPSKSYAQRAVAAAVLGEKETLILGFPENEDSRASLEIARGLGAGVREEVDLLRITPGIAEPRATLNCRESGLAMRMFTPLAALQDRHFTLRAEGTLRDRPMMFMEKPLADLGAVCGTTGGKAPVSIRGPLKGGNAVVENPLTSQFLTGLLLALPRACSDSLVTVTGLVSIPYVAMTMELLRESGVSVEWRKGNTFHIPGGQTYSLGRYVVEGDWSGAAFLLVAGAITGSVTVEGLNPASAQGDSCILTALELAGAEVTAGEEGVTARLNNLRSFQFCVSQCPDLAPPLAVLAACCPGTSVLTGTRRLSFKETDRTSSIAEELSKVGVAVRKGENFIEIAGGEIQGGTASSRGDHRIAMALAVAGLRSRDGISIQHPGSVEKSYPGFFGDLAALGGITGE